MVDCPRPPDIMHCLRPSSFIKNEALNAPIVYPKKCSAMPMNPSIKYPSWSANVVNMNRTVCVDEH